VIRRLPLVDWTMTFPAAGPPPRRVLFVCTGNICRSPLAEAVFKDLLRRRGLEHRYEVDSAGTHGWHEGEPADPRTIRVGARHGLTVDSTARGLRADDFDRFDVLVAMDRGHLREMRARCPKPLRGKLLLMPDYDPRGAVTDVPDPYYGPADGFEEVHQILDRCCQGLLDALESEDLETTPRPASAPRV
jgi:low molecular weight protein-tyrosine phosphatase